VTFSEKIQAAKDKVKIPELWRICGYTGEPRCGAVNRCPWREDKNPSFSITPDGRLWNDFTDAGGDAVVFLERAFKIDRKTAMYKLLDIAFGDGTAPAVRYQSEAKPYRQRNKPELPGDLHRGTKAELQQLADLRKLKLGGLMVASDLGLLQFCKWEFADAWVIMDSSRIVAQVRRLDGGAISTINGDVKAFTMVNSWVHWPVGMPNVQQYPEVNNIALVEGGPDLLAACQFGLYEHVDILPIAMLGANPSISAGAVPMFANKRVIIFRHNEKPKPVKVGDQWVTPDQSAGDKAAARWQQQLISVARSVTVHRFCDGIKDLNDLAVAKPDTRVMIYD
jgi:hypothetical protein